jgi:hypothetical protein
MSASLSYVTVKGEGKLETARAEKDAICRCRFPSLPVTWLAGHRRVCNGRRNTECSTAQLHASAVSTSGKGTLLAPVGYLSNDKACDCVSGGEDWYETYAFFESRRTNSVGTLPVYILSYRKGN